MKIIDSRQNTDWTVIRRRRVCKRCGARITTYEATVDRLESHMVEKFGSFHSQKIGRS